MTKLILKKDIMNMLDEVLFRAGTRVELVSCEDDYLIASHTNSDGEETTFPLNKGEFEMVVEKYQMQLKNVYGKEDIAEDVATVSINRVGRSLVDEPEKLAQLIGVVMNSFGNPATFGDEVGEAMRTEHRTIQRAIVVWLFHAIAGISKQEYTDARNEYAIDAAKKLVQMLQNDEFNFGSFI